MNILPKKSWHVKNRKNIERVQRDEAEAERLNNIEHDRRMRAEQEARVAELRARAGIVETITSHINLFDKPQEHQADSNREHGEEKRQEQPRHGIINRLVRAEDVNRPWYCQRKVLGNDDVIGKPRSSRITSIYDPLTAIKQAEDIVKAKRQEQKKLELQSANQNRAIESSTSMIPMVEKQLQVARFRSSPPAASAIAVVEHDSSPEIIEIVKSSKNKLNDRARDSGRSKKSKKSKTKHKKCKHHHHNHHHHKKHRKHKS